MCLLTKIACSTPKVLKYHMICCPLNADDHRSPLRCLRIVRISYAKSTKKENNWKIPNCSL